MQDWRATLRACQPCAPGSGNRTTACEPPKAVRQQVPGPNCEADAAHFILEGRETDPLHNSDLPPPLFRQRATLITGAAGQTLPVRQPACAGGKGKTMLVDADLVYSWGFGILLPGQFFSLQSLWRSSS